MKNLRNVSNRRGERVLGFTLTETVLALLVVGVMITSLYATFTFGYGSVRLAREDLRATQILLQRMEMVRLTAFTNLNNATSTAYYDPTDQPAGGGGTVYSVTVSTNKLGTTELQSPVYYLTNMVKITA